LKQNLSAQLIDCGLAKFVTDDNTSISIKGTAGCICPQYCQCGQSYNESCEYIDHDDDEPRPIIDDIDSVLSFHRQTCPKYVHNFARLAFDCMHLKMKQRPSGKCVIDVLQKILDDVQTMDKKSSFSREPDTPVDDCIVHYPFLC
jgi:hypothetical protein